MIEMFRVFSIELGDVLLGWTLSLQRDLRLLAVAVLTVLFMKLIRLVTTRQEFLRRVDADVGKLGVSIKAARRAGDVEAVRRHRRVKALVQLKALRAEFLPLLVSMVPVAMIATWAWQRLEFEPPAPGEPVGLVLVAPVASAGGVAHVVPADGLEADGWVRRLERVEGAAEGTWRLSGGVGGLPDSVTIRQGRRILVHDLTRVCGGAMNMVWIEHEPGWRTRLDLRPVELFGAVPGIAAWGMPGWVTGYLLLVILLMPVSKRVLRIR